MTESGCAWAGITGTANSLRAKSSRTLKVVPQPLMRDTFGTTVTAQLKLRPFKTIQTGSLPIDPTPSEGLTCIIREVITYDSQWSQVG
jgi:hypothetical protein